MDLVTLSPLVSFVALALVAVVMALACWAIYAWPGGETLDDRWSLRLNGVGLPRIVDATVRGISHLGLFPVNGAIWLGLWWVVAGYFARLAYISTPPYEGMTHSTPESTAIVFAAGASIPFLAAGSLCFLLWISCRLLKRFTNRPRPYQRLAALGITQRGLLPSGSSFPSSHAAMVCFTWPLLVLIYESFQESWALLLPGLLIVLAVSFSRVYLGAHFPRDVLAGWVLGIGFAAAAVLISQIGYVWWQETLSEWILQHIRFWTLG